MDYLKRHYVRAFIYFLQLLLKLKQKLQNLIPVSIPISILKLLKATVDKPLETLFISSFSIGIFPNHLKLPNVIPGYKKDSQFSLSNYRPISLLSVFNKRLEKLVSKRLLDFLEKENILFDKQFGFLTNHSTDHANLSITDKIQRQLMSEIFPVVIFLDFSKAFDTVNHAILIRKLGYYGIRGIASSWFSSYLNNRQQTVTVNNTTSAPATISCGVPQGSVLGPITYSSLYK